MSLMFDDACLTVVDGGHEIIIGRDFFSSLGWAVVQQRAKRDNGVNNIDNSTCKVKQAIASQFPNFVSRIGLSKTHIAEPKFHQKVTANHRKSRGVPINL